MLMVFMADVPLRNDEAVAFQIMGQVTQVHILVTMMRTHFSAVWTLMVSLKVIPKVRFLI